MANSQYWNGVASFTPGITPFGYYDSDLLFQEDCVRFADYASTMLGWEVVAVELTPKHFFTAYEDAVITYSNELYNFKIRENMINYEGAPSGSAFNNVLTVPSLGNIIRISKTYGSETGTGGLVNYYSGSIDVKAGKQVYDLKAWATVSGSLSQGDSIEIKRIFHYMPPASTRWYDPFTGTNISDTNILESTGLDNMALPMNMTNYLMTPVSSYDVARLQAIEYNDEIRRSTYSFEIRNNVLRLFPFPTFDTKVWFEYIKVSERDNVINPDTSGGGVITDPSNVPFGNITYTNINSPGKSWILKYALSTMKGVLALIRGKFTTVEIPRSAVTMNYASLEAQYTKERDDLMQNLRDLLEATSRRAQLERQAFEASQLNMTLANIPLKIYVG